MHFLHVTYINVVWYCAKVDKHVIWDCLQVFVCSFQRRTNISKRQTMEQSCPDCRPEVGGGQFCQFPEEYNLLYLKTEDLNCAALGEKYLDPADISENQIDYLSSLTQQILILTINSFTFLQSNQVTNVFFSPNYTYILQAFFKSTKWRVYLSKVTRSNFGFSLSTKSSSWFLNTATAARTWRKMCQYLSWKNVPHSLF